MVKSTFSTSPRKGGKNISPIKKRALLKKGIIINYLTHALPVLTCCSKSGAFNDGMEVCHSQHDFSLNSSMQ